MRQRERNISLLDKENFDVLIVGGGINGAASAAALSAKGAKVALVEKADFASFTSQHSSNLAWGGIKYMESCEFGLVRRLCKSRNHLIESFPATVREIRFLTTVQRGFRHRPFVLWLGAWLYWLMGNGFTQKPRLLSAKKIKTLESIIDTQNVIGGIEYSDAYLFDNDARFVFGFIRSALKSGCVAVNYCESLGSVRDGDMWHTRVKDTQSGEEKTVKAKLLINAAGAYVDSLNKSNDVSTEYHHLFSKGIHLIVDTVTPNKRVLAFFASDGRLFFVIPMGSKTCVGTTDTRVPQPETEVTNEDRDFVLDNINRLLALEPALNREHIIAERCGVRPLAVKGDIETGGDFLQLSRKHALEVDENKKHISIFGGKLTDCINVGEEIYAWVSKLCSFDAASDRKWYGESGDSIKSQVTDRARRIENNIGNTTDSNGEALGERLWRRYGQSSSQLLDKVDENPGLAEELVAGTGFRRVEADYVARNEMIVTLEDFLRRRSKIALTVSRETLKNSNGLWELCETLFGGDADKQWHAYFESDPV